MRGRGASRSGHQHRAAGEGTPERHEEADPERVQELSAANHQ